MYNHAVHKTVLLQSLIALLHDEGIEVNTAAALSIDKILFHTNLDVYNTFSKLKFRIVPILSRNKEEQEIIYRIFDKLDEKVKTEASNIQPPDIKQNSFVVSKAETPPVKWTDQLRRLTKTPLFWIGLVLLAGLVVIIVIKNISSPITSTQKISAQIIADKTDVIANDTVHFTVQSSDSTKKITGIKWMFSDTSKILFNDTVGFTAQSSSSQNDSTGKKEYHTAKVFHQSGEYLVKALLKEPDSKKEDTISYSVSVLCESTPSVAIDKVALPSTNGQTSQRNNQYIPHFTNPSKDSARYRYHWYVNDELLSSAKVLNYKSKAIGNNKIKLVVDCKGIHCSADSLVYTLDEQPPVSVSISGDGKLQLYKTYNWTSIFITLFSLLAVAIVPGILVYRLLKPVQKKKTEEEPPELQEPYSIHFDNQDHTIHTQKEIDQLADILRKRHVSDIYKLSIRKTIQSTVRSGGLPALAFLPVTKPSDYLVFVETNNEDSHLERLFKYLIAKLENEQVYLTVYEYRKEPLYLSNEKMNHIRIPVDKVASLYPDRTLLIFGDTKNFVLPLKNTLKKWVTEKFNTWSTKIIITPFPKNDWDKKEQLLIEAKFTVIPADLNANSIIEKIINGNIETQSEASFSIPATYTTRSYNFNEFDSIKDYLGNENLLKWVCSLAVYPSIDWNFTIATGKKLEDELANKGQPVELVNYSNLLKISRISWLQDGIVNDTLRIQMLGHLDNETEMLARQTLVEQLNAIENEVSGSMIKRQFDVHQKMNSFLLNAYENKKPSKNDEAFIKEILSESQMDEAHEIYLNNSNNTLLKDPFEKGRSVNFKRYFKATALRRKLIALVAVLLTVIALAVILSIITGSGPWIKTLPSNLQFVIRKGNVTIENLAAAVQLDNSNINLSTAKDSVSATTILISDTSKVALLTVISETGQLLAQDSFKLNSKIYTVQLSESTPVPLEIFYKNASDLALANSVEESLPTNFDVIIGQQDFKDTAISITYSSDKQKKDADLVNAIVSKIFTRNVKVVKTGYSTPANIKNGDTTFKDLPVAIYITSAETCTPLTVAGLPKELTGNWHGGINNRNTEIDLTKNLIKYSTGDVNSFGLYSINEVCLRKNNVYRLITKTDKGYKPFYVMNISARSFEWSVCQVFYKTKAEIIEMDESSCGTFNTMKRVMVNVAGTTQLKNSTKVKDSSAALNTSTTFTPALRDEYQKMYDRCELYQPRVYEVDEIILNMTNNKARYDSVAKVTGVPWYFIAILHYADGAQDFTKHLHNGDPLTARTVQVPKGRPVKGNPPFTWEESAVDALTLEGFTNSRDWSIASMLYLFEKFNGMGYRKMGLPSPYLWAGSNLYTSGKFNANGTFDPKDYSDKQIGAGVLLKVMDEKKMLYKSTKPLKGSKMN